MNAGSLTAIITGATALVGAITALVKMFRHQNGPAHKPAVRPVPPPAPRP